ncbi:MAG: DUF5678 domain-containing protein [archaeon]
MIEWEKIRKYGAEWVVVNKNKVVSHGKNAKKVYEEGMKFCSNPRIFQVPKDADEVYLL